MTEWLRLHEEFVLQDCRMMDDLEVSIFLLSLWCTLLQNFQLSTLARASQTSTEDRLIVELDKAKALAQTLALSTCNF